MGPGSESTLRIDEPLHFMFLVAYLITYFCCAYILFMCFKHFKRLVQRKPSRPVTFSRLRSVAEALNNLPCRTHSTSNSATTTRQLHVSLCHLGGTHAVLCPDYEASGNSQSQLSVSDTSETNTSRLSPAPAPPPPPSSTTTFTFRRIYYDPRQQQQHHRHMACLILNDEDDDDGDTYDEEEELPGYDSLTNSNLTPLPPSYSECVLSTLLVCSSNPSTHPPDDPAAAAVADTTTIIDETENPKTSISKDEQMKDT